MEKIEAKDVNFYYGDFHALKGISMEIPQNQVVAFIGPSGCGKSTFLRLFNRMNDLIPGTRLEGQILIDGQDIYLRGAALWDEVKDKLNDSAFALSGGQQQRLCIARAMAVSPSVLLMDEPASALDPISTAKVEELISELRSQVTIVIVTHNMQQAARVSDRTAFFYMGEMVEYDDTRTIFTNPHKEATQNYITGRFG